MNVRARILASFLLLFVALTYLFAWSPIFTVKSISTSGLPKGIKSENFVSQSKVEIGEKMARIEPRSIEKLLGETSWVKEISVSRNWIKGDVAIAVKARVPVGLYKGRAIDSFGTLFELPGDIPKGLPTVSAATPELGLTAIALFTELPPEMRESLIALSAINISSINSGHRESGRDVKITWGSSKDVELKVSVYRALLALEENQDIRRVDLSAPHAPIVK